MEKACTHRQISIKCSPPKIKVVFKEVHQIIKYKILSEKYTASIMEWKNTSVVKLYSV